MQLMKKFVPSPAWVLHCTIEGDACLGYEKLCGYVTDTRNAKQDIACSANSRTILSCYKAEISNGIGWVGGGGSKR